MNVIDIINSFAHGALMTVSLMLAALVFGLIFSLLFTFGSLSEKKYLKKTVDALIFFVRGTPLLVQLFLIYYGLAQFNWLIHSPLWLVFKEPFACATLALGLNTAAYSAVLLKGAIASVPANQIAACEALGMSKFLMMRRIVLPEALRLALPAYSNEVIMILKATSLASTITIMDVLGVANQFAAQTYQNIKFLMIAGLIYLALNAVLIGVFKLAEKRMNAFAVQVV